MHRRRVIGAVLAILLSAGLLSGVPAGTAAATDLGGDEYEPTQTSSTPSPAERISEPSPEIEAAIAADTERRGRGRAPGKTRVLQLNLCLSGLAPCFSARNYRGVVRETVYHVRDLLPDAVIINEACTSDVKRIARRTGMHVTFSRVIWAGRKPLPCFDAKRRPASDTRGWFGNALLTRARPARTGDWPYLRQDPRNADRRRIMCTRAGAWTFCGTHLAARKTATGRRANDAQCRLLARLVGRYAATSYPVVGGDMNRTPSCAPGRSWRVATDKGSRKRPGIQHVYADPRLGRDVRVRVVPMRFSDHNALLMTLRR